jgi:hypothetical protein
LFSCKGEDGDIGPKGDAGAAGPAGAQGPAGPAGPSAAQLLENGFIKGTLKGKRRDGTAFEETFEYKLAEESDGFVKTGTTIDELFLWRYQDLMGNGWIGMNLLIENKGLANQSIKFVNTSSYSGEGYYNYREPFELGFQKLLPDKKLFKLSAEAVLIPVEVTLPISRANNITYKLVNYGIDHLKVDNNSSGDAHLIFSDETGNLIYFKDYNLTDEYEFAYLINSNGQKINTSTVFGDLVVVDNFSGSQRYTFYTKQGVDLSETIDVPADTYEITNFSHDTSAGVVTFDYKINIQQFRVENTTRNPLEITGSVRADVYNEMVMRKSAE